MPLLELTNLFLLVLTCGVTSQQIFYISILFCDVPLFVPYALMSSSMDTLFICRQVMRE